MTPHDLIAAFDAVAEAPDGVQRLRELILQLAVRGKLVRQDPVDEPASVRLAGRVQSPSLEDAPFPLPSGWAWSSVSKLGRVLGGGTPSKDNAAFWNGNIPWVTPKDMKRDLIADSRDHITEAAVSGSSLQRVPAGALLMVVRGMILAHSFPTGLTTTEVTVNQDMKALVPFDGTVGRFLLLVTKGLRPEVLSLVERSTHGTCKLPTDNLFRLPIPIAPWAEQHRIVARVDELMGLLDRLETARTTREATRVAVRESALNALQDADKPEEVEVAWNRFAERMNDLLCEPTDIAPLRQAVLQLAVRGRLVSQDPTDEPASVLLERIAAEKTRLVRAGAIRRQESLPPVSPDEIPFDLPDQWVWTRLGNIALQIHYGFTASADPGRRSNRFLRITDIQDNRVDWSTVPGCIIDAADSAKWALHDGDIVIARTGGTVGKTYRVEGLGELQAVFASYLIRVTPASSASGGYLKRALETPLYWEQLRDKTTGTGQPNVNASALSMLRLPFPPLAEQHRIVAKVDELMGLLDRLEERLAAAQAAHVAFTAAAVHHLDA